MDSKLATPRGKKLSKIFECIANRNASLFKKLLSGNVNLATDDWLGVSFLHLVCQFAWLKGLKIIHKIGGDTVLRHKDRTIGQFPVWVCSDVGALDLIRYLCENGAKEDLRSKDFNLDTPFCIAAIHNHLHVTKWMIEKDGGGLLPVDMAYVIPGDNGVTCMWHCAQEGHLDMMIWLQANGRQKDILTARRVDQCTPVHACLSNGHVKVLRWLYINGAKSFIDSNGEKLMQMAHCHGRKKIIRQLNTWGIKLLTKDIAEKCVEGGTRFRKQIAARYGSSDAEASSDDKGGTTDALKYLDKKTCTTCQKEFEVGKRLKCQKCGTTYCTLKNVKVEIYY